MKIADIEDKVALGEMSADQVFTQMLQHVVNRTSIDDSGEVFETIPKCELDQNRHDRALMLRALKRISVSPYNDFGGANNIAIKAINQVYG